MTTTIKFISPWIDFKRTTILFCPKVKKLFVSVEDTFGKDQGHMICELPNDFETVFSSISASCTILGWTKHEILGVA